MKKKSKRLKTISKLKKELWKIYALYMKLVRSNDGYCKCYTCDSLIEIGTSNCQMGHWLPKGGYSYHYFTENNTRPQCFHCNISLSGNTAVFEYRLRKEIGNEEVDKIFKSRHFDAKRDRLWYEEKIDYYKNKVELFLS